MSLAMFRTRRVVLAKGVLAVGLLLLAGCSAPKPVSQPSVTFGSGGGSTPGMPGMTGMPSTGAAPTGTASVQSGPDGRLRIKARVAGNGLNILVLEPETPR